MELKDGEIKVKRQIEDLLFKPIFISINDINRFKKIEMKKIRSVKGTWYEWSINCIPKTIRKSVGGLKYKIVSALKDEILNALEQKTISLFDINTPKETGYGRGQKLSKPRKQIIKKPLISEEKKEKIKDILVKYIWKLFKTKEEKEQNERLIKEKRLEISEHFLNWKKKIIINLKE